MNTTSACICSRAYVLDRCDIDTDQIIPARFLTTTERSGLGRHAFADWRYNSDGCERGDCLLNDPARSGASIIIAGRNFGCGSSREHAAWALHDFGIRAVISTQIADIFAANALNNGIAPSVVDDDAHQRIATAAADGGVIDINIEDQEIRCDAGVFSFELDAFGRRCLLDGVDALGWMLQHDDAINAYHEARDDAPDTRQTIGGLSDGAI